MRSSILLAAAGLTSVLAVPSPQASGTLGLGVQCTDSSQCANGADCYSTNSGLIRSCGNFQARCSSNSQCAFNTCEDGFCNGFIASTTTTPSAAATGTSTMVGLPLGADCNPDSTPCANGANCYATNFMLQPRCGNFQASCSNDSQCAFNTCNQGFCNGFIASSSGTASTPATSTASNSQPTSTPAASNLPLGANCNPDLKQCANGADCYATNSMLQPRCGNFQASCTDNSQCAFNTCNGGLCNGFIPGSSSCNQTATSTGTGSTPVVTPTPTSSGTVQINANAASASKSGPFGIVVACAAAMFAFA